ncbi:MAG: sugar phosphate isomerase/epimerase [Rubrobacter sp.]|jgi:sugar phosphate isomerase/epimerase|nr:sugar phosphate isomerase/epimerase [Rubrobacter sp.]
MLATSVGTNLTGVYQNGLDGLPPELAHLETLAPDFVEVWPEFLGIIAAGGLDRNRTNRVKDILLDTGHSYTVHAPFDINLMDTTSGLPHRGMLAASIRFAAEIEAPTVVCHSGQRLARRDALVSFKEQIASQREALREAGDLAEELGVTIAVENYYPDARIVGGEVYDTSTRPSELAEMVSEVNHPSVGVCLDTGHAALSAAAFGFDLFEECEIAAPLVHHVHIQDNFQRVNFTDDPPVSEHRAFGLGDLHLPPGSGTIPLVKLFERMDFPHDPSYCAELSEEFPHLAGEALAGARGVVREETREALAS